MGSFSIWHWLIVLLIIVLVFGTKKLKNIGKDLGTAIKDFKEGLDESNNDKKDNSLENNNETYTKDKNSSTNEKSTK